MKIQCFIFGLIAFATVAHSEIETENRVAERRLNNRRLSRLEDSDDQIDNGNRRRHHHHHHFVHNAAWHRRHGIPMPGNINATRPNDDELANSDAEITNRLNSDELGNRSNNSGKRCCEKS